MKKIWGWIIGVVLVVGLVSYIIWGSSNATPAATTNTNSDGGNTTGTGDADMGNASGSMVGMNMNGMASGSMAGMATYKDGTYTGSVADAVYGQLQVTVTISGGMITDVTFPVYPNSPGHTSDVSASALPALKQEAIAAQSSNVNVVSGATQDSQAFQQSLAAALAQAQG